MLASQSEFNRRITRLQDSIERLTNAQEQKTAAEYFYTQAQEKKVWEEIREQIVKSDVAEETKEAEIESVYVRNWLNTVSGLEKLAQTELHEADAKKILEETRWIAFDMQTRRITADATEIGRASCRERV